MFAAHACSDEAINKLIEVRVDVVIRQTWLSRRCHGRGLRLRGMGSTFAGLPLTMRCT
jgi:hypothetical protein